MEREYRTVWEAIWNSVELAHKRAGEATVTTLKTQVPKIDSFTKKMESTLQASFRRIKELNYAFRHLRQRIEHLYNLENERSRREDEISLGNPKWMEGSQDKGESPISHSEMETILNNIQECLNANYNHITGKVVLIG